MIKTLIYEKSTGITIDIFPELTSIEGLNESLTYNLFEVPDTFKVGDNISEGTPACYKDRVDIIADIYSSISGDEVQTSRILDAMDKYPTFALALDARDYTVARLRLQKALDSGDIIQDDYDLINSKIPA